MRTLCLFLAISICSFSASAQKADNLAYEKIKNLIESRNFIFEASSVLPREGSSRSLVTNLNFMKVEDDVSIAMLPYFGNYRLTNGGGLISFDDNIENVRYSENKRKSRISLSFRVKNEGERFSVQLSVGSSGWATVIVKSINRPSISYYGKIKAIPTNKI